MDLAPPIDAPLGAVATERMNLRRFTESDVDPLAEVFSKPEVWQFPYGRGFTRDETRRFVHSQIDDWERFGFGCWLAELTETGQVIGYVGLSVPQFLPEILPAVEVGWRFDPDVWGLGLASEAAAAALAEGFTTLGLHVICSLPQTLNRKSYAVCDRLGMRFEGTVICPATDRRGAVEARLYELTIEEWASPTHDSLPVR